MGYLDFWGTAFAHYFNQKNTKEGACFTVGTNRPLAGFG